MEIYACVGCGATFVPGLGDDNIHEQENSMYEAYRDGKCPVCEEEQPEMDLIMVKN